MASHNAEVLQAQLAAIVESSDDAIIGKTLDGVITSWNGGAERLYGFTAEEAIGKSIGMIFPADSPDELQDILDRVRRGETIKHFETVRIAHDGRRIDVSVTVSPIRGEGGAIVGASSIARDIGVQRREELRMVQSRQQLATIFAGLSDGVTVQEASGRMIFANAVAARLCGVASA